MHMSGRNVLRRAAAFKSAVVIFCLLSAAAIAEAESWNGIEPFKSRRDDVLKILGKPVHEGESGTLRFEVAGGIVTISFVDAKFVNTKKLRPDLAGTVLEIVLQHESSSSTPESMKLLNNKAFARDETGKAAIFRNPKEGIVYTFLEGRLKTTRYTFSDAQLGRARK